MKRFLSKSVSAAVAGIMTFIATISGVVAQPQLADFTVSDLKLNDAQKIEFTLANNGALDVDPDSDGFIYVYVDDKLAWSYNWKFLGQNEFLIAGEQATIVSQMPRGQGSVEVCIDAREHVGESNEENNCRAITVAPALPQNQPAPEVDLAILNLGTDSLSNNVIVEFGNIGSAPLLNTEGALNIYLNDTLKWSYSWRTLNKKFLNPGGRGMVQPLKLERDYKITACLTPRTVVEEITKTNNCRVAYLKNNKNTFVRPAINSKRTTQKVTASQNMMKYSGQKPDLTVKDIYRDVNGDLTAEIINKGGAYEDSTRGFTTLSLNGQVGKSYRWRDYSDTAFLKKNGLSRLVTALSTGSHQVKVCTDTEDNVPESNENNNCLTKIVK